ncbi:hypothetical protein N7492_007125 [Penicillium capsulatum]|uniref:Rhodopsin domain-containing protein n=1 Tax=Penicillium capsulatum TaxID=69766 RepID=A0A9W9LLI1_9EURO|nr:hypothetical protein N7492_007125 [Penicillium capsulatum]
METPLLTRGLYPHLPPEYESRTQINPTLMMSWWATGFSLVIIIVRLCGRYIRIERFFPEDKVMMLSMIPLTLRMVLVHFVLIWGTNNVQPAGLTPQELIQRQMGSKLVLAARIFYAIFIWTAKLTVCEFLKRVTGVTWRRSVVVFLRLVHFFLASTLVAVVIATLAECQPFHHYWQVIPDPGPTCRAGYAQLITMGTCDVITDLLLVAFPVPIILMSHMPVKRKVALVALFCLSLVLVAITCFRVPSVIDRRGSQPYRSLIASLEILAATAVSNVVVISSVMRRNTVMQHQWGSDCDLAADLGIRLDPELCNPACPNARSDLLPSVAPPVAPVPAAGAQSGTLDPSWSFHRSRTSEDDRTSATDSLDIKVTPREYIQTNQSPRKKASFSPRRLSSRQASFFDVGGLLSQPHPTSPIHSSPDPPSPVSDDPETRRLRGSRDLFQDVGVLTPQSPVSAPAESRLSSPITEVVAGARPHSSSLPPYRASPDVSLDVNMALQDVGGLLSPRHPSSA